MKKMTAQNKKYVTIVQECFINCKVSTLEIIGIDIGFQCKCIILLD